MDLATEQKADTTLLSVNICVEVPTDKAHMNWAFIFEGIIRQAFNSYQHMPEAEVKVIPHWRYDYSPSLGFVFK